MVLRFDVDLQESNGLVHDICLLFMMSQLRVFLKLPARIRIASASTMQSSRATTARAPNHWVAFSGIRRRPLGTSLNLMDQGYMLCVVCKCTYIYIYIHTYIYIYILHYDHVTTCCSLARCFFAFQAACSSRCCHRCVNMHKHAMSICVYIYSYPQLPPKWVKCWYMLPTWIV